MEGNTALSSISNAARLFSIVHARQWKYVIPGSKISFFARKWSISVIQSKKLGFQTGSDALPVEKWDFQNGSDVFPANPRKYKFPISKSHSSRRGCEAAEPQSASRLCIGFAESARTRGRQRMRARKVETPSGEREEGWGEVEATSCQPPSPHASLLPDLPTFPIIYHSLT